MTIQPFTTILLLVLLIGGCGPDDPILAKVGDSEITASQLDGFVDRLSLDLLSDKEGVEADREYLESMIDQEMLVEEARSRGLDTSSAVTHQLEAAVRHRFYQRYEGQFVNSKIEITPTEIERAFRDVGFDRERLVSRILLKGTEKEARAVLAQLYAGRPFADVLAEHGVSDPLADDSGKVAWVGLTSLGRLRIPQDAFSSLSQNEPLLIEVPPGVWEIIRFEQDREADIQHYADELNKIVRQEQWWRRINEEAEVLGQKFGARSHPEGLQTLIKRQEERRRDLTEVEAGQPLYSFADGDTITAGDFIVRVREEMGNSAVGDSSMIVHVAENRLLFPKLFVMAAHDLGWVKEEGFRDWRERKQRGFMINHLVKSETEDSISLSEKEMRDYYEQNQEKFRTGEVLVAEEVHAEADSTVRRWRAEIEAGGSFADIFRANPHVHSYGAHKKAGLMTIHRHRARAYPELADAAFAAEVGELVGPLYMKEANSYAIFRLLERQESQIKPFDEMRKSVEHMMRNNERQRLTDALFRSLRDKYESRIVVFDEQLKQRHTEL